MPTRHVRYVPAAPDTSSAVEPGSLAQRFAAIRDELHVPGRFPAPVLEEADRAAGELELPEVDLTDLPFVTLDPPGSMDLDQAMHLERSGPGYRVRYAIADLPAFVRPGGALDTEARTRGLTVYLPDRRAPLHPPSLSEDAASLLPGRVRPAYVWDLTLDAAGAVTAATVAPARVRSVERLDYATVQAQCDAGTPDPRIGLLREIGERRLALESERGGASLPMPEQQVVHDAAGHYLLQYRPPLPAEDWNAQISLMTGMAAARIMLDGGVGILRTLPAPEPEVVRRFRRQARALGVPWPDGLRYGDFLRTLERDDPRHLALVHEATGLFRGAGYTPFDGTLPAQREHAAVAAPYAHVTAPLRRLVDRFGLVVCAALAAGQPVPEWARAALAGLPDTMREADRRASAVERACVDAVEAAALRPAVGSVLPAWVVDLTTRQRVIVQLTDPAVLAPAHGQARAGDEVSVLVAGADVATGRLELELVGRSG